MDAENKIVIPSQMLLRIQAIYDSLKRAERSAADFILEHPDFVAVSSIATLAKEVGVSQPTFVRLAKRIGYSGYAEMKEVLASGVQTDRRDMKIPYESIDCQSKPYDIAQSITFASIQALKDLLQVMNPDMFDKASNAILNAKDILFLGAGDSSIVASFGYQKFIRTGVTCHTANDFDTQIMLSSMLDEKSVCVLVSHSGDTSSIVQSAKLAKSKGATTIAITNFPYSHLARVCDIVLLTATFVERGGEVVTQRIAQMTIIESLFIIYRLHKGSVQNGIYEEVSRILQDVTKL